MTRRLALSLLVAAVLSGCEKEKAAPPPSPLAMLVRPKIDFRVTEQPNLLNLGYGAVVLSRTGEATLDSAAIYAIDGDSRTSWTTPPDDVSQSITIALPARSRIERVGLSTGSLLLPSQAPGTVAFETSLDGKTFQSLARVRFTEPKDGQLTSVTPTESNFVRATIVDSLTSSPLVFVPSLQARGTELEAPRAGDPSGCWNINGDPARFAVKGKTVSAVVGSRTVLSAVGGYRNRVLRLTWLRGQEFGQAAVTASRDGRAMDALSWHEDIIPTFAAPAWFGSRAPCGKLPEPPADFMQRYFEAAGWFPLYAIATTVSGDIDSVASVQTVHMLTQFLLAHHSERFRIVSHEFRGSSAAENRAITERQLATLRQSLQAGGIDVTTIQFIASGSERPRQEVVSEIQKAMFSAIEIEPVDSHHLMP